MSAPDSNRGNGRDRFGKFAVGNPGGPGNPQVRHLAALRQAVADATTPDDVRDVLAKLRDQALAGDTAAARVWLERCLGRPPEQAPDLLLDFDADLLQTPEGFAAAFRQVVTAAARGELPIDAAQRVAGLLESCANATLVAELDQRLTEIEKVRR